MKRKLSSQYTEVGSTWIWMFNGEAGAWGDKEVQIGGQMLI